MARLGRTFLLEIREINEMAGRHEMLVPKSAHGAQSPTSYLKFRSTMLGSNANGNITVFYLRVDTSEKPSLPPVSEQKLF